MGKSNQSRHVRAGIHVDSNVSRTRLPAVFVAEETDVLVSRGAKQQGRSCCARCRDDGFGVLRSIFADVLLCH